ncbi:MAG: hypothetical protein ACOCP8_00710 [archaeon]
MEILIKILYLCIELIIIFFILIYAINILMKYLTKRKIIIYKEILPYCQRCDIPLVFFQRESNYYFKCNKCKYTMKLSSKELRKIYNFNAKELKNRRIEKLKKRI